MSIQTIPDDILVMIMQTIAQSQTRRIKEVRRIHVVFDHKSGVMFPAEPNIILTDGEMPLRIHDGVSVKYIPVLEKDIALWTKLTQDPEWHFIRVENELDYKRIDGSSHDGEEAQINEAHTQCEMYNYEKFAIFHRF